MTQSEDITSALKSLRESWESEWGYEPRQINEGECMEFVNDFFLEFDIDGVSRMETDDLPEEYVVHEGGFHTEPYHMWLTDGKLHYDAEVPEGVDSWKKLPFFKRTLGF